MPVTQGTAEVHAVTSSAIVSRGNEASVQGADAPVPGPGAWGLGLVLGRTFGMQSCHSAPNISADCPFDAVRI